MIHTHTMTQLKTQQGPMSLLSSLPVNTVAAATGYSANLPATTITTAANAVTIPVSSLNYIKVIPVFSNTGVASPTFKVTGYSKTNGVTYMPQCLFEGAVTMYTTTQFAHTVVTGLTATLALSTATVTLTSGSTAGFVVGQSISTTGYTNTGAFAASVTVASIISATQFTVSSNHVTAGAVTFDIRAFSGFNIPKVITKTSGDGKLYSYNASTGIDPAFVLIDTLGCDMVKIEFLSTAAATAGASAYIGVI